MAPQLQINQGPQDALLFDNTKSYFGPVGYSRTSNFQMELRDVDAQNAPSLGGTVNFVIPKAADLLGPVDLMIEFDKAFAKAETDTVVGWVESVGLAMIEKITFSVGSHDVETLTGEHLNIMNELMRSDKTRLGFNHTLKTGRPLVRTTLTAGTAAVVDANGAVTTPAVAGTESLNLDEGTDASVYDRIIATETNIKDGKKLIVPLGLFFTTHPSKYFPLAAVAGCNDVRISIKFRTQSELVMCYGLSAPDHLGKTSATVTPTNAKLGALKFALGNGAFAGNRGCYLRCHYVHVTGPEATALMNREHVRLMKLWNGNEVSKQFQVKCTSDGSITTPLDIDLSFLHPVQELVITIRKVSDMGTETGNEVALGAGTTINASNTAQTKNYFAYHGGGKDPNPDSWINKKTGVAGVAQDAAGHPTYLKSKTFQLKLNGQSRHLDGAGIDREYLVNRLMPMLHSNTSEEFSQLANSVAVDGAHNHDLHALAQIKDRKEIYVYPFALNPEGHNPSGSVNFSKVSHAKLSIGVVGIAPSATTSSLDDYQVDVYGVYYNWLAIKDGRALTSFA